MTFEEAAVKTNDFEVENDEDGGGIGGA
jgi:hypothetical protein